MVHSFNDLSYSEMFFSNNNYVALYPELFLIIFISGLVTFLVILDYKYQYKFSLASISAYLLIWCYLLCILLILNNNIDFLVFHELLIVDSFSNFIKIILLLSLIGCILISLNYLKKENFNKYEYFVLLGLSSIGMLSIISSNNLITMYIAIEIQSLCFYIMATMKVYNNFSTEAGLKYFILGAFSSGILLFGCSLIYASLGTTNFNDMKLLFNGFDNMSDNPLSLILGILFIIVAILFKVGAAPFHMWLPDVYEGVPTIVTVVYAIVPKIALFLLLVRLNISLMYENFYFFNQILLFSALVSIIIGTLGALYQSKIKRLFAYSAISHVGFLLLAFSASDTWSIFSLFFYLVVYIIISLNVFIVLLVLRKVDNNLKIKKINEIVILFKSNPLLAINFCFILFSIAGIPPLVGFYSKFYVFIAAIKSGYYFVVLIAAIFSVIASMYYIRLIKLMFFKTFDYWAIFLEIPKTESLILSTIFFFNLLFFCYPELFVIFIYNNVLQLLF